MAISTQRFQSGDICIESGWYEFDGYLGGGSNVLPPLSESAVELGVGDIFPTLGGLERACFWKPTVARAERRDEKRVVDELGEE